MLDGLFGTIFVVEILILKFSSLPNSKAAFYYVLFYFIFSLCIHLQFYLFVDNNYLMLLCDFMAQDGF